MKTLKIVTQKGLIPNTLSHSEKIYEGELLQTITTMQSRTDCNTLTILPNFDFGFLLPPPTGFVASFDGDANFNADLFRAPKYNIFLKAKIKWVSFNTEKHKEIEKAIRLGFSLSNENSFSCLSNTEFEGWTPCFTGAGSSIGIYHSKEKDLSSNEYIENSYIICHSMLPRGVRNELQEIEERLSCYTYDYYSCIANKKPIQDEKIRPYTYGEVFADNSAHDKALKLAIENSIRLVTIFASVLKLELAQPMYERDVIYHPPLGVDLSKFKTGLTDCIKWWPKDLPIFPFTILPEIEIENFKNETIPDHLRGFPLGAALDEIKRKDFNSFTELCKKYDLDFRSKVMTFKPDLITDYNTHRLTSHGVTYYCGSSPCRGTKGVLVYEGLDLGFKHINHSPNNLQQIEWFNHISNAYPVIFPFVEDSEKKKPKADTVLKYFTLTEGGVSGSTKNLTPEHFYGLFVNQHQLNDVDVTAQLGTNGLPIEELIPDKVFLSPNPFNISRF